MEEIFNFSANGFQRRAHVFFDESREFIFEISIIIVLSKKQIGKVVMIHPIFFNFFLVVVIDMSQDFKGNQRIKYEMGIARDILHNPCDSKVNIIVCSDNTSNGVLITEIFLCQIFGDNNRKSAIEGGLRISFD